MDHGKLFHKFESNKLHPFYPKSAFSPTDNLFRQYTLNSIRPLVFTRKACSQGHIK